MGCCGCCKRKDTNNTLTSDLKEKLTPASISLQNDHDNYSENSINITGRLLL